MTVTSNVAQLLAPDRASEGASAFESEVRALRDRQQVIDALYRFAAGQDLRQPELFLSAFTDDARLDFTQPARPFGAHMPVMAGRDAIGGILTTLAPLDTTHTVTNRASSCTATRTRRRCWREPR